MGLFDVFSGSSKKKRKGVGSSRAISIARGQNFKCAHCPKSITKRHQFHIDHKDGDRSNRDITNLQALCVECHSRKSHRQTKERTKKLKQEKNPFSTSSYDPFGLKPTKTTKRKNTLDNPLGSFGDIGFSTSNKPKRKKKNPSSFGNFGDIGF
jgi:hypothetical protein